MRFLLGIKSSLILLTLVGCGGQGINWHPNPYLGDYKNEAVIREGENGEAEYIYAFEERFNTLTCFAEVDLKRLVIQLQVAEIPKKYIKLVEEELAKIENQKKK